MTNVTRFVSGDNRAVILARNSLRLDDDSPAIPLARVYRDARNRPSTETTIVIAYMRERITRAIDRPGDHYALTYIVIKHTRRRLIDDNWRR